MQIVSYAWAKRYLLKKQHLEVSKHYEKINLDRLSIHTRWKQRYITKILTGEHIHPIFCSWDEDVCERLLFQTRIVKLRRTMLTSQICTTRIRFAHILKGTYIFLQREMLVVIQTINFAFIILKPFFGLPRIVVDFSFKIYPIGCFDHWRPK